MLAAREGRHNSVDEVNDVECEGWSVSNTCSSTLRGNVGRPHLTMQALDDRTSKFAAKRLTADDTPTAPSVGAIAVAI